MTSCIAVNVGTHSA